MKKLSYKYMAALCAVSLFTVCAASTLADTNQMNIVLIMADDIAYDVIGCYGSTNFSTPRIDQLAGSGAKFNNCHSTPVCTPSRVKIMTGRSGLRNYWEFGRLSPTETTFGHMMKTNGYVTAMAGKWQLADSISGGYSGTLPNEAGFDETCMWSVAGTRGERYWGPTLTINGTATTYSTNTYGPDICVDFLIDFIADHTNNPFLVYYPMLLTHGPFDPTPDSVDRNETDGTLNHKDMVAYMDKNIGKIVDALELHGLRENTVIMFTGDNGTARNRSYPFMGEIRDGQKAHTRDGGTHVALVVNSPGNMSTNIVIDDIVDFSDILPTIADIANVPLPNTLIDGRSFWPQCQSQVGNPREAIFQYYQPLPKNLSEDWLSPFVNGNLDYIIWVQTTEYKLYSHGLFFHVSADRHETTNIPEGTGSAEAEAARTLLQGKLHSMIQSSNTTPLVWMREYGVSNYFYSIDIDGTFTNAYELVSTQDTDGDGLTGLEEYQIDSDPTDPLDPPTGNMAPVFSSDPINKTDAFRNVAYSASLAGSATDANGDPLTYSRISGPPWLGIATNGTLSGIPSMADVGPNIWTVEVSDGSTNDTATLNITVETNIGINVETEFSPAKDAYVKQGSPTNNFGSREYIDVRNHATRENRSYLQFNVTSDVVDTATLSLYPLADITDVTASSVADNSWDELAITWSNKPTMGPAIDTVSGITSSIWINIDVSSYVTGTGTYSFALTTTHGTAEGFSSKEGNNPPKLVIISSTPSTFGVHYPGLTETGDENADGVDNYVTYAMGGDPAGPDSSIYHPALSSTNGMLIYHLRSGVSDVYLHHEWTENLLTNSWFDMTENIDYMVNSSILITTNRIKRSIQLLGDHWDQSNRFFRVQYKTNP